MTRLQQIKAEMTMYMSDYEWLISQLEKAILLADYYSRIEQCSDSVGPFARSIIATKAREFLQGLDK